MIAAGYPPLIRCPSPEFDLGGGSKSGFLKIPASNCRCKGARSSFFGPVKAMEGSKVSYVNGKTDKGLVEDSIGKSVRQMSTIGNSTNIVWHKCSVEKIDRQELLQQKGCVIWITGLSGSGNVILVIVWKCFWGSAEEAMDESRVHGKSTLACALSRGLHGRGKLTYILDGDNVRHGLNRDLSFGAEDRAENIRRVGEVAKLFADAGVICIASLISPYRKDRDACRALLSEGEFIEVFMDMPLRVCEARDPKGLYKLAREGKIKGFTGIDDPYEPPLNSEIVLQQKGGVCASPCDMAGTVISYLEDNGYLIA